jgi:hypothetical protein
VLARAVTTGPARPGRRWLRTSGIVVRQVDAGLIPGLPLRAAAWVARADVEGALAGVQIEGNRVRGMHLGAVANLRTHGLNLCHAVRGPSTAVLAAAVWLGRANAPDARVAGVVEGDAISTGRVNTGRGHPPLQEHWAPRAGSAYQRAGDEPEHSKAKLRVSCHPTTPILFLP